MLIQFSTVYGGLQGTKKKSKAVCCKTYDFSTFSFGLQLSYSYRQHWITSCGHERKGEKNANKTTSGNLWLLSMRSCVWTVTLIRSSVNNEQRTVPLKGRICQWALVRTPRYSNFCFNCHINMFRSLSQASYGGLLGPQKGKALHCENFLRLLSIWNCVSTVTWI